MSKGFNWNVNHEGSETASHDEGKRLWQQIHLPEIIENEEHQTVEEAEEKGLADVDEIPSAQLESSVSYTQEGSAADTGHVLIGGLEGDGSGGGLDSGDEGGMGMDGGAE